MDHLHVMQLKGLLKQERQRCTGQFGRQLIMRFAGEHTAKAVYFQRCFVALLLLQLNTPLGNRPELVEHRLLAPGVSGHQYVKLLLHQVHAFRVVPETIF